MLENKDDIRNWTKDYAETSNHYKINYTRIMHLFVLALSFSSALLFTEAVETALHIKCKPTKAVNGQKDQSEG